LLLARCTCRLVIRSLTCSHHSRGEATLGTLPNTLLTTKLVVIPEISKDEFEQWDNEEEAEKVEKHHAHVLKGNTSTVRKI